MGKISKADINQIYQLVKTEMEARLKAKGFDCSLSDCYVDMNPKWIININTGNNILLKDKEGKYNFTFEIKHNSYLLLEFESLESIRYGKMEDEYWKGAIILAKLTEDEIEELLIKNGKNI